MKLSDIKGEKILDVIADLIVPVANIAVDEEASDLFIQKPLPEGMTVKQFTLERVKKSIPALLKHHKDDVIAILATLSFKDIKEYEESLTIIKLINGVNNLLNDEMLLELFTSAQTEDEEESSGTAQEDSKEEA